MTSLLYFIVIRRPIKGMHIVHVQEEIKSLGFALDLDKEVLQEKSFLLRFREKSIMLLTSEKGL